MAREATDDVVHRYTRVEALADGVLVDVTRQASPAEMHGGFLVPVAITAALWHAIEAIPPSLAGIADVRGRLHDVLWMASLAVRRRRSSVVSSFGRAPTEYSAGAPANGLETDPERTIADTRADGCRSLPWRETTERPNDTVNVEAHPFAVHLPTTRTRKRLQTLRVDVGPDDGATPCVTIGFPEDF